MFWTCVLNGACGHTYGANGIWQVNTRAKPYGPSPHGMAWGDTPWEDAYLLPGLGAPRPGAGGCWSATSGGASSRTRSGSSRTRARRTGRRPSAAGIPGKVRVIYVPLGWEAPTMKGLEPGVRYRAYLWNPRNGDETDLGESAPDAAGDWRLLDEDRPVEHLPDLPGLGGACWRRGSAP